MNLDCEFSCKHYFEVLTLLKQEYFIGTVGEYNKLKQYKKFLILRHDVDISLDYALKMAKLEKEHGLRATYFILLHSSYYNALSKSNTKIIKEISDLGHEIGLHYDTDFLYADKKKIILQIQRESQILSDLIGKQITSIAQHNTSISKDLDFKSNLKNEGFIDSRDPEILKQTKYISDSGRYWREGCMCKHINKHEKLQILTHPIWWVNDYKSTDLAFKELKKDEEKKIDMEIMHHKALLKKYYQKIML